MKKSIISIIMAAVLLNIATAQNNNFDFSAITNGKTLYYKINGNNVSVTYPRSNSGNTNFYVGYAKPQGELVIPSSVTHNGTTYNVNAIDGKAFFYCSGITGITIPNTVQSIGDSAFTGCSNLTSACLGESVASIGYASFRGCSQLPSIVLPASLATIDNYAFFACSMLKKIGVSAMTPPVVTGNTLTADTLVLHCGAMSLFQNTFPWSVRFSTVIGFDDDLPKVYDTVIASCSYLWHGTYYHESCDSIAIAGVQQWTCDSLYILNLTIENNIFEVFDTMTLCNSMLPYQFGDILFDANAESGDYSTTMASLDGCDSVVYLNLTIHESEQTKLCMVSVGNGHNVVMWPKTVEVAEYNIYREGATTGDYELVATIPYDSLSLWMDETSRPVTRSYRYRITSIDLCGIESEESEVHKTMHLTINQGVSNSWNLIWTEYEGATYSGYQIYRGHSADDMELIDEMPADGNTSYTDPNVEQDSVYYQVAIVKDEPCLPTKGSNLIFSNIATNNPVGIGEIENERLDINIIVVDGRIIVSEAGDPLSEVKVYDMMGRKFAPFTSRISPFSLPNGVYLVMVGDTPARRVVVIR